MKTFEVLRIGKCYTCGHKTQIWLGEFDTETEKDAINKAIENWDYENFGQAGALRERDERKNEEFLDAKFIAKEIR